MSGEETEEEAKNRLQAATSLTTIAVAVPYALGGLIMGML